MRLCLDWLLDGDVSVVWNIADQNSLISIGQSLCSTPGDNIMHVTTCINQVLMTNMCAEIPKLLGKYVEFITTYTQTIR